LERGPVCTSEAAVGLGLRLWKPCWPVMSETSVKAVLKWFGTRSQVHQWSRSWFGTEAVEASQSIQTAVSSFSDRGLNQVCWYHNYSCSWNVNIVQTCTEGYAGCRDPGVPYVYTCMYVAGVGKFRMWGASAFWSVPEPAIYSHVYCVRAYHWIHLLVKVDWIHLLVKVDWIYLFVKVDWSTMGCAIIWCHSVFAAFWLPW